MKRSVFYIVALFCLNCNLSDEKSDEIINHRISEYEVYNQVLPEIGIDCPFCECSSEHAEFEAMAIFEMKYPEKTRKKILDRLKKEKIDTSKVPISLINFIVIPDSLEEKGRLKPKQFDKSKLNFPVGMIPVSKNDSILNLDFHADRFRLSRINFRKNNKEAIFNIEIFKRNSVVEYKLHCKFKNGAWEIEKKYLVYSS